MIEVSPIAGQADEQLSLDLYNVVFPHEKVGLDAVHSFKASVVDHIDLLARVDGQAAGSALAVIGPTRPKVVFALGAVLPEHRRRGVGAGLYDTVSKWTRERGIETIEAPIADDDPDSLAFAQKRGFKEDRREKGVALDLTRIEAPEVKLPEGVEIVSWAERPELDRGMYEVALEAEPDIPGAEDDEVESFDAWLPRHMQAAGDKPEATFVALAGDEVVGWAKFSLTDAMPTTAHHDLTGVKRAWRGRGIARALKATQIAWAKANGYEELQTRNDERNAPIRHLNEEFGYRPMVGRIYLQGPLAG